MKNNKEFRFSYDRKSGLFTVEEFLDIAKRLDSIVKSSRPYTKSRVLSFEESDMYHLSTGLSFLPRGKRKEIISSQRVYSLDELNGDIWDKAYRVKLIFNWRSTSPNFISLTHNTPEADRLFFYAQCLDTNTHYLVTSNFDYVPDRSSEWRLGDGFSKPSGLAFSFARKNIARWTKAA